MGVVSFKGVIIGGVLDVVASVLLGLPFAIYTVSRLNLSGIPTNQVGSTITAAIRANVPLYVGQLLVGLACSALGGYVAAWLAKHHELLNGALSSFLCVSLGIYLLASGQDSNPHWLQALLLVASPALALVGGDLMRRQRQGTLRPIPQL
jgi:uncharacterized membrane protein YfcA